VLGWQWRTGLQGADRLIAVSQQNQTDWIEANFSAQKITVVYNGVDPERFRPCDRQLAKQQFGFTSTDKLVTYVGRLDQSKGIETLLRAFALLPMNTQPHLLIVGKPVLNKPAYEASLKQLASILGVANQVTFWGYLANPIAAFQASDVVVVPSVWSEPFGRIIVEAMACGTPVLASRIGGIPEILGGEFTSGLFAPGNAEDLANKLQNRLNWQQTDPTLGQRCRQHVMQQFTLKQTIDGIEQVFIEVTQARSAIALNETEAAYRTQIN
jgi:glycosyltransferase involved in cell wall biosynthesis